ncbi:sulfotransferase [Synechococcus sp. PCC 7336]|uniref:sulfotransferase n=1 Tax=Synechococcus sp. PCC 7336 TaxID=195250 RepID=UPI001930AE05|nr:sulfotransferase [Synechococcus sp. PCC 7336]
MLEKKTPKNSLRIPFLQKIFPQARFVFLHRRPEANISSIVTAWRSGRFVTYRNLPHWQGLPWSLVLPPNWPQLNGASLAEIAAFFSRAVRGAIEQLV